MCFSFGDLRAQQPKQRLSLHVPAQGRIEPFISLFESVSFEINMARPKSSVVGTIITVKQFLVYLVRFYFS